MLIDEEKKKATRERCPNNKRMPVGIGKESGCKQASYEARNCNDKAKR